ncbi:hypothetical protein PF004_g16789 [Phytophthora fragariae]|uniref:Kinesin-like protein n=1 Tax=Phytophthora fragariae TaxID=53985 RepID=A0A6G0NH92_9STRA|nr:hypothetical protein PF004_g16789 [Phytophthora fragariae]
MEVKKPLSIPKSAFKSPKRPPPPPLAARVRVAVRVRPPLSSTERCIAEAESDATAESSDNKLHFQLEKTQKCFQFDHVFLGDAKQTEVFNAALQPLLASLLHGFNVTVLAYGQTGSGKTYTMGGTTVTGDGDGLIPHFLRDLFGSLRTEASMKTTAKVSFLEIYCDEIRDLLIDASDTTRSTSRQNSTSKLTIHEDDQDVWVEGLLQVKVKNVNEAINLLKAGRQRQTIGAHALNDHSSRSHAVYTLEVARVFAEEIKRAKLTFVDLAGSERVKKTLMEGQGMKEGSHINIGLLALGNVINALGSKQRLLQRRNSTGVSGRRGSISGGDELTPRCPAHVPYRSSKLTRLLRDALGGNSVTLFIACISSETTNGNETLCTLQYANRARSIQNKAQKNVEEAVSEDTVDDEASVLHGTESEREIYALREQVEALKSQLEQALAAAKAAEARNLSFTEPKTNTTNLSEVSPANFATKSSKAKRRLRIAPLELDIPELANIRELSGKLLESDQREGVISRSTQKLQQASLSDRFGTTEQPVTLVEEQNQQAENVTPVSDCLDATVINAESKIPSDNASESSPKRQVSFFVNQSISGTRNGCKSPQKMTSRERRRQMTDQSTQYESPLSFQHERKTPIDYVLLSPSQIYREVHHQQQKALAGAPSPWPHRRRLDTPRSQTRHCSISFPKFDSNNDPSNQRCSKSSDALHDILQRTRHFFENGSEVLDPDSKPESGESEHDEEIPNPLSFEEFLNRMVTLYDQRSRQQQFVHRLTQRFRHLTSLLGITDAESQMIELSKYTLVHQLSILQQRLESFEGVVADRLWRRLQHRESAIESYAENWNDKVAAAFLSDDQYEACTPWHAHRADHDFFQHRILPFVLNGWISVAPGDLENEQLWLTL